MKRIIISLLIGISCGCFAGADRLARVDAGGILRWADDSREVALLGVNYYTPFTIDFAAVAKLGLDHRQVIRDDVAHFRRLGLGCIRIHCFDREFSDAAGHLVDNRHLELLDFVIDECRRNGLYTVLTPIAWWGNMIGGKTNGFSDRFDMPEMTTDREAWKAQVIFLKEFASHVNRFTGQRYADDPCVLAFECINEPLYPKGTPDALVTEYINTLADALRSTGTAKPIYYNSWQGRNAAAAAARVDGVTCSSYPTGLCAGHALAGSRLGQVHGSSLQPDASLARLSRMAYEFDAADVAGSYMYPAMAKMFRAEGVQVASQFQYDPLALADVNQNWKTHHLNLVYTPGKALALAIAAEVFARVPRATPYERAAESLAFSPFRVSAAEDLSEMVTADRYLSSNATRTPAPDPAALTRVWGCGSSPVVAYGGSGAYFLDRVADGVWRLQLYPDVFTVADPYTGSAEPKVRVISGHHPMTVRLPDLGERFTVRPFDGQTAGGRLAKAKGGAFEADPGDYLLTRSRWYPKAAALRAAAAAAPRYVAPSPEKQSAPLLRGAVADQWRAGRPLAVRAEAVFATHVTARLVSAAGTARSVPLVSSNGCYAALIPGELLTPGAWSVRFHAEGPFGRADYPDAGNPDARWFPTADPAVPLLRLPPTADAAGGLALSRSSFRSAEASLTDGRAPGSRALRLTVEGFGGAGSAAGYTLPFPAPALASARAGLRVVTRGGPEGARFELGFRMRNGQGLGCNLQVGAGWSETVVPANELLCLWGLPSAAAFRWQDVERVSVLTGPWLWKHDAPARQTLDLASVEWLPLEPGLPLTAADGATPWSLFSVSEGLRATDWSHKLRRWRVTDDAGRAAIHLGADDFTNGHDNVSMRVTCDGKTFAELWQTDGERAVLHVRARAAGPRTTGFELAVIESDGTPWGTVVPLTTEWQTVRIPLRSLRLFTQWGKEFAAQAGPRPRLARLSSVNVCFGKWLFPRAAAEPHAVEIAEIGVTAE